MIRRTKSAFGKQVFEKLVCRRRSNFSCTSFRWHQVGEWVWFDGGEKFEEYLKLETAAQELEEYFKHDDLAALIREYQAQES